jgi:hypothetical protein
LNSFELVNPRAAKDAAITPVDAAGAAGVWGLHVGPEVDPQGRHR